MLAATIHLHHAQSAPGNAKQETRHPMTRTHSPILKIHSLTLRKPLLLLCTSQPPLNHRLHLRLRRCPHPPLLRLRPWMLFQCKCRRLPLLNPMFLLKLAKQLRQTCTAQSFQSLDRRQFQALSQHLPKLQRQSHRLVMFTGSQWISNLLWKTSSSLPLDNLFACSMNTMTAG